MSFQGSSPARSTPLPSRERCRCRADSPRRSYDGPGRGRAVHRCVVARNAVPRVRPANRTDGPFGSTGEHCKGVVDLALAVGNEMGLDATRLRNLEFSALLHNERHAGSQCDPAVVRALVAVVSRTEPTDTSVKDALLAA